MARCAQVWLRRLAGLACLVALSAASSALADTTPETTTDLGTQAGFARFLVDAAHNRVFVSESQAGAVAVLDPQGRLVTTIRGLPGAYGLAIAGNYVYVAAQQAGSIFRIDLSARTLSPQIFVSGLPYPTWLAYAANHLWVGTAPPGSGGSSVISIDPVTRAERTFGNGSFYGADFATSPADPNALYMAEAEEEPEPLHRYDLGTFPPRETASNPRYWAGAWGGMTLSADGSRLEGAAGADGAFQELCSQTLQPDGIVYPGSDYPGAVATASTGVLATGLTGYDSPNLAVYRVGVTTPFWSATTPDEDWLESAGLALSPDGRTLYAAVDGAAPGGPTLLIDTYALPAAPNQTVADLCPMPTRGTTTGSGGSSGAPPGTTSVSRSGRTIIGRLRVRLPRHPRRPAAAFLLTLTLQPRPHRRPGYHYSLTVTGLRCAGRANEVRLTFASRHIAVSCRRRRGRWTGTRAFAHRYAVRVASVRTRKHRAPARGRTYLLSLRP